MRVKVKDICINQSSNLKQKDVEGTNGKYQVFGASGVIGHIDNFRQDKEYIAIVKDGSGIGRVTFLPPKSSIIGTMQYILPKNDYSIKYIGYCLKSLDLAKHKKGAAIPHIYFKDYGETEINVTLDSTEQTAIVEKLDLEFAKIDLLKNNAQKQLDEAKALFQSTLKQLLQPKEDWEEKRLEEVCEKITDGTHNSPINTPSGDYKYITAKNIKLWGIDLSNLTYVSTSIHKEIYSRCNPEYGDILYIKDGATTGIAVVNSLKEEFSLLSSVALLKINKDILYNYYLCYYMNSPSFYQQTRNQMDGSAITRVTLKKINSLIIYFPKSLDEQRSIVEKLDAISSKIKKLEENYKNILIHCDDLKQAILREIFG